MTSLSRSFKRSSLLGVCLWDLPCWGRWVAPAGAGKGRARCAGLGSQHTRLMHLPARCLAFPTRPFLLPIYLNPTSWRPLSNSLHLSVNDLLRQFAASSIFQWLDFSAAPAAVYPLPLALRRGYLRTPLLRAPASQESCSTAAVALALCPVSRCQTPSAANTL